MKNLKELSIADLKALFDYFKLMVEDAVSDDGKILDHTTVIQTEPKLTAVNEELQRRVKSINFS